MEKEEEIEQLLHQVRDETFPSKERFMHMMQNMPAPLPERMHPLERIVSPFMTQGRIFGITSNTPIIRELAAVTTFTAGGLILILKTPLTIAQLATKAWKKLTY